jgi:hypothetical protein
VSFRDIFEQLGAFDELAPLAQLVIRPAFGLVAGFSGLVLSALALLLRRRRGWSLTLSSVAFVVTLLALAIMIYGLYSPLFAIGEALEP